MFLQVQKKISESHSGVPHRQPFDTSVPFAGLVYWWACKATLRTFYYVKR